MELLGYRFSTLIWVDMFGPRSQVPLLCHIPELQSGEQLIQEPSVRSQSSHPILVPIHPQLLSFVSCLHLLGLQQLQPVSKLVSQYIYFIFMFRDHQDSQVMMNTKIYIRRFLLALNSFSRHQWISDFLLVDILLFFYDCAKNNNTDTTNLNFIFFTYEIADYD